MDLDGLKEEVPTVRSSWKEIKGGSSDIIGGLSKRNIQKRPGTFIRGNVGTLVKLLL